MEDVIRSFSDLLPEEQSCAGGKGGTLARLRTGDRVAVDGVRSEVEILETGVRADRSPTGEGI